MTTPHAPRWPEQIKSLPGWLTSTIGARLWLRGCEVGAGTKTFGRPHIENRGRIVLGARVRLNSSWAPLELVTAQNGLIEIGDGTFVNYGTLLSAYMHVRIGRNVMIGNYCIIADTEIAGIGEPPGAPALEAHGVEIGDRAWLAARVSVLPGSHIGAGAVIAAGSIVSGNIPDGAVAAGIPARVIRVAE